MEAFQQRLLEGGNKRDFCLVTLYACSGIRRNECVNLRLDQVDLAAKEIRIVGKGDKHRLVYINDKVAHAIREYLKVRQSDSLYLFPRATSRANMLACSFGDCRASQIPNSLL